MASRLPLEVIQHVISFVLPCRPQSTLHAASLVSRAWYSASIESLYNSPLITGKNFDAFVRSVCPSINAHIRHNGLAELVRRLDMSGLVHNGSKSLTARLLGRVKNQLEAFVAPQASFAVNCLAALSKCGRLQHLNLSFVSEAIALSDLLRTISTLPELRSLQLPRSSIHESSRDNIRYNWPPNLQRIDISGGLSDRDLVYFSTLPSSVSHLRIENCPNLSMEFIEPLIQEKGIQLRSLRLGFPMPSLRSDSLNLIKDHLPNLHHLSISTDYSDWAFFDANPQRGQPRFPALRELELDCLHAFKPDGRHIGPGSVWDSIATGPFTSVRKLRVHWGLAWTDDPVMKRELGELNELLQTLAREDGEGAEIKESEAGVVMYGRI